MNIKEITDKNFATNTKPDGTKGDLNQTFKDQKISVLQRINKNEYFLTFFMTLAKPQSKIR